MRKIITIFGGSGLLGRLIARRYAKLGYEVRVAVRRPNQALFVRTYGEVGQVNPVQCNVRDEASTARVIEGAEIVVNAVSAPYENKFQNYEDIKRDAAERIARLSAAAGVRQLVHISGIGADANSKSQYVKLTAEGDALVLEHFPKALIIRPSVLFGGESDIFNRFGRMVKWSWIMPVVSAHTKIQPVYAEDVAEFIEWALQNRRTGIYELGGADILSMREIVDYVCKSSRRRRWVFNLPGFIAVMMAYFLSFVQLITLGIIKNHVITRDQLYMLEEDNIVRGSNGLEDAKIVPERYGPIEEPYMVSYRPQGEFEDLVKAGL